MKKQVFVLAFAASVAAVQVGCSSAPTAEEKAAEEKVQAEKPTERPGELAVRGYESFINSTSLTAEQKKELMKIHTKTYEEASVLRDEITKAKSALFKVLATGKYNKKEVKALKSKIEKLDKQRLQAMFKAFDQVERVVGQSAEAEQVYEKFMMERDHL